MNDNPIILDVQHKLFEKREKWLKNQLQKALDQPFVGFSQIISINDIGMYMIYDETELLYIGITTRKGNARVSEISQGYRKHTFNRKRLAEYFRNLGYAMHVLSTKNVKRDWIDAGIISVSDFKDAQKAVNSTIKQTLRYKFYEFPSFNLQFLEHFAISTLQPLYND